MFDYAREEVMGWLLRPLDEYYPIVYIDALFWSTRRDGAVSKEAYYTILGVKSDRTREVLGIPPRVVFQSPNSPLSLKTDPQPPRLGLLTQRHFGE